MKNVLRNLNKKRALGIVRHGLTILGGALVAQGRVDPGEWETLVGGVLAVAGTIWSILAPEKKNKEVGR